MYYFFFIISVVSLCLTSYLRVVSHVFIIVSKGMKLFRQALFCGLCIIFLKEKSIVCFAHFIRDKHQCSLRIKDQLNATCDYKNDTSKQQRIAGFFFILFFFFFIL